MLAAVCLRHVHQPACHTSAERPCTAQRRTGFAASHSNSQHQGYRPQDCCSSLSVLNPEGQDWSNSKMSIKPGALRLHCRTVHEIVIQLLAHHSPPTQHTSNAPLSACTNQSTTLQCCPAHTQTHTQHLLPQRHNLIQGGRWTAQGPPGARPLPVNLLLSWNLPAGVASMTCKGAHGVNAGYVKGSMRGSCSVAICLPVHRQPVHMTLPLPAQKAQPSLLLGSVPLPTQCPHVR